MNRAGRGEGTERVQDRLSRRLKFVPRAAGVYIMRDHSGRIIYVGKSSNLRRRLSDYLSARSRTRKVEALVSRLCDFEVHPTRSEEEALLLEERLIREFLPRYNIALRSGRTRYMIVADMSAAVPRLEVAREPFPVGGGIVQFGPFSSPDSRLGWSSF